MRFHFHFKNILFFLYTAYYRYSDNVYEQPASNTKEQLCVKVFNKIKKKPHKNPNYLDTFNFTYT